MILFLFIIISLVYIVVSYWLSLGLQKLRSPQCPKEPTLTFDILIAARNEEENLPILFDSLSQLEYPSSQYTITVINDRSTDGTAALLSSLKEEHPNLQVITIEETPANIAPKKHAIAEGINATSSEIIVSTDADSIIKPDWLRTIASYFSGNPRLGLLQGITKYENQENTSQSLMYFQRVDFISHCIIAAAGIGRDLPINSNANNFAYRRETFNNISGFEEKNHIVSGDDDLLLQKIWKSSEWNLGFMIEDKASVVTQAMTSWKETINQRIRWGSKTVHYENGQKAVLGSIFLFYIITLISIPLSITGVTPIYLPVLLLFWKIVGELFFLVPGTKLLKEQELLIHVFWTSPIQLFVVVFSVFYGVFGKFTWKNQAFKRELK